MPVQPPQFEWKVAEREEEWRAALTPERQPRTRLAWLCRSKSLLLLSLRVLLLLLIVGGYFVWRTATAGWNQIEAELRAAVELDEPPISYGQAVARNAEPGVPRLRRSDRQSQAGKGVATVGDSSVHMQTIDVSGEKALIQVVVTQGVLSGEIITYRETRFYWQSTQGWLRIESQPAWLGAWQTLETEHFQIHVRKANTQTILTAVGRLESLFDALHRDFGLSTTSGEPKVVIEVGDDTISSLAIQGNVTSRTATVPSPALYPVPAEISESDVFFQSTVHLLSTLYQMEARQQQPDSWRSRAARWQLLLDAFNLWELWASDERLVGWRSEYVNPFFVGGRDSPQERLCVTYKVWDLSFTTLASPPSCFTPSALPKALVTPTLVTSRDFVAASSFSMSHLPNFLRSEILGQNHSYASPARNTIVALATVIDYVVKTYGRERLPRLFDACGTSASWNDLIPSVFGVSASQFEQGWKGYLADRYPSLSK